MRGPGRHGLSRDLTAGKNACTWTVLAAPCTFAPEEAHTVEFRVLGPLEALVDGEAVPLGGTKQKALLAYLLLRRGEAVSSDRLVDALWGGSPPATAGKNVHVYVSRLRRALGEDVLVTRDHGYAVRAAGVTLDSDLFSDLLRDGRGQLAAGNAKAAAETLRSALSLWRGPPLADLAYEPSARDDIAALADLRLAALESRAETDLATGKAAELVPELEALIREEPLRERPRALLMLALYRSARQADALETYRSFRRTLDEELGIEPGPELRQLEQAILRQDPDLDRPDHARTAPTRRRRSAAVLLTGAAVLAAATGIGGYIVSRDSPAAGLTSLAPNSLGLIDPHSNRIVAQIPVGSRPRSITVGAGSVWVANTDDATLSRVDPGSGEVVRTLALPGKPTGLAADKGRLWATTDEGDVLRVDTSFNVLDRRTRLPSAAVGYQGAEGAAIGLGALWVLSPDGLVYRISRSGARPDEVDVGNGPDAIAVGAGAVWVANGDDGTVSRIDPSGVVTTTIPVGHGPAAVAAADDGVWVADSLDGTLVRIDPATGAVSYTARVGVEPAAIALTPGAVWVALARAGSVARVDPRSGKVVNVIHTGGRPVGLAAGRDGVWVVLDRAAPSVGPQGGTLRVEHESPFYSPLDPAQSYDIDGFGVLYATCAKLFNYPDRPGPAGTVAVPEVAESAPAVSSNGLVYTFRIRSGFRFSPPSGEAVTAASFERAFERVLSAQMKSYGAVLMQDVAGAKAFTAGRADHIAGVHARGDVLTIRLTRPSGNLVTRLALPFFCAVPRDAPIDSKGIATLPSAGPYYVASYTSGVQLVLRRNPNYRGPRPHRPDRIVYTFGIGQQQSVQDVEAGRVDFAADGFPADVARRLESRYGTRRPGRPWYSSNPSLVVRFLVMNNSRGVFADPRMRHAAAAAIDKVALSRELAKTFTAGSLGGGVPTDHFLPPGLPGAPARSTPPGPDPGTLARLIPRHRVQALMYTCNHSPCPEVARIVRESLAHVGIDVTVQLLPTALMFVRAAAPDSRYDLMTLGWSPDYPDPASAISWLFDPQQNFAHFHDARYAREYAAATQLPAPARFRAIAALAHELETDAVPAIPYELDVSRSFFSARTGCQVYQPVYGIDLAALCLRS